MVRVRTFTVRLFGRELLTITCGTPDPEPTGSTAYEAGTSLYTERSYQETDDDVRAFGFRHTRRTP